MCKSAICKTRGILISKKKQIMEAPSSKAFHYNCWRANCPAKKLFQIVVATFDVASGDAAPAERFCIKNRVSVNLIPIQKK